MCLSCSDSSVIRIFKRTAGSLRGRLSSHRLESLDLRFSRLLQRLRQLADDRTVRFFQAAPAPPHEVETLTYENLMHGESHGVEISANWKVTDRWQLSPGLAFEELHLHTDPESQDQQQCPFGRATIPHTWRR